MARETKKSSKWKTYVVAFALAALIVVLLLFAMQKQIGGTNWVSLISNYNNTRYQPNSSVTASNIGSIKLQWKIITNSSVTSTPVTFDGNVFFGDWAGGVYSANIENGSINWNVNLGGPISSTPTLVGNVLYIAFGPNQTKIFAISALDGARIWNDTVNSTMKGIWASPIVYNGLLYVGVAGAGGPSGQIDNNASKRGQLFALNSTTGQQEWNFTAMIGNAGGAAVWSSASVDPQLNTIYFGTGNAYTNGTNVSHAYSVVALDATTGSINWIYSDYHNHQQGEDYDFGATPNLFTMRIGSNDYQALGIGSKNGYYYILNRENGNLISDFSVGTAGSSGGIIGLSGVVPKFGEDDPEIFIPAYYDVPNVSCCGVVEALIPSSNTVAWRFYTTGNIRSSVTVIPGAVLVGDDSGNFYAISTSTGAQLLDIPFNNSIAAGITSSGGYVFVPTSLYGPANSMGVYAFTPS